MATVSRLGVAFCGLLLASCGAGQDVPDGSDDAATRVDSSSDARAGETGVDASEDVAPAMDALALDALDDGATPTDGTMAMDVVQPVDAPMHDARADVPGPTDAGTPSVLLLGRIDRRNAAGPRFDWPGASIVARFSGTAVAIQLNDSGNNRFRVAVDGTERMTLAPAHGMQTYALATGLAAGTHTVELWRLTEGSAGVTQYVGMTFPGGGSLLPPPARVARRIEVIGDSITCGYGDEGTAPCEFSYTTESNYIDYGPTAARALGAEIITIAASGWGMYRDYSHTMNGVIPNVYDRTLQSDASSTWDFTSWIPDAVVINLGTNDYSMGNDPGQPYTDAYVAFLHRIRSHYPHAYIFAGIGPTNRPAARIMTAIATLRAGGDTRISFLQLGGNAGDGQGCNGHPNRAAQAAMGAQVATAVRGALGW